jgi:hypothetical protein
VTLAEIIAEGRRLDRDYAEAQGNERRACRIGIERDGFYREHGPRLLACLEAAVEMRNEVNFFTGSPALKAAARAFDAAAGARP